MTHHRCKITLKAAAGSAWSALQNQLQTAHKEVRSPAVSGGRYRTNYPTPPCCLSVAVSPEVPYGMTYERNKPGISPLGIPRCHTPHPTET
ncbi:hypothetical protein AHIS1636_32050 [Arthrobacter mangrovi]|uniref:Uncharacterized protein n=1 Tax=Arthrobacter mangrovi TaxID=2966350 RepID=A0ABQ5MXS8_9MICC|nr:hypothetical protein AHIS1636_32050 [Arthrobacter mangrovi]